jgi:hypothetical protein
MLRTRKAAVGYAAYVVGNPVARRTLRRRAHTMIRALPGRRSRPRRRRIVPLVGGTAAAIVGASLIAARRHHSTVGEH